MNRFTRLLQTSLAVVMGLLIGMAGLGSTASAHPARQADDPVALFMALAEAYNNGDITKIRELLDSSFQSVTENPPPGMPPEFAMTNLDQFLQMSQQGDRVTVSNCQMIAPDIAACDVSVSGGEESGLPHPYSARTTITVRNGKIAHMSDKISEQTYNDLAALLAAQPGMPTTGSASQFIPVAALAIALLAFATGALLRRRQAL